MSGMRFRQRGDTIIEVLIALAILGLIIGVAYASANRSLRAAQRSQERGEALKVAETQLEFVKNLAPTNDAVFTDDWFCIAKDPVTAQPGLVPLTDDPATVLADDDFSGYPADCQFPDRYHAGLRYDDTDDVFELVVRWDRLGGGKDEVKFYYGLSEVLPPPVATATLPPGATPPPPPPSGDDDPAAGFNDWTSPNPGNSNTLYYGKNFLNNSTPSSGSTINACTWLINGITDSSYARTISNRECQPGDRIYITFPRIEGQCRNYRVTLTIYDSAGKSDSYTETQLVPLPNHRLPCDTNGDGV